MPRPAAGRQARRRLERAAELAMLRLEELGNVTGALEAIEPFVETFPKEPALRKVALAALHDRDHAARAVEVLERVADAIDDKASRAEVYEALFEKGRPRPSAAPKEALYEACSGRSGRQEGARGRSRAAARVPESDAFWDRAEELARSVKRPEPVAEAYRAVLARSEPPLLEETALRVGERGVAFHEEWFDDQELVTGLLRRVMEVAPSAHWAFERELSTRAKLARAVRVVRSRHPRPRRRRHAFDDHRDAVETARDPRATRSVPSATSSSCARSEGRQQIESQLEVLRAPNRHASLIAACFAHRSVDRGGGRATRLRIAGLCETARRPDAGPGGAAPAVHATGEAIGSYERLTTTGRKRKPPGGCFRKLSEPTAGNAVRAPAARLPSRCSRCRRGRASRADARGHARERSPAERIASSALTERRSRLHAGGALSVLASSLSRRAAEESNALDAALLTAGDYRRTSAARRCAARSAKKRKSGHAAFACFVGLGYRAPS
jgi:hypothetical protein